MLTQQEIDATEPDFEAVKLIAVTYFKAHFAEVSSLPAPAMQTIAALAGSQARGVTREELDAVRWDDLDRLAPDRREAAMAVVAAYFVASVRDFFDSPQDEIEGIARRAGVGPDRWPGFCKAVMSMHHPPHDCPRAD